MDWLERLNASRGIKNRILPIALLLKATARAAASSEGFNGFYRDNAFQPSKDVHLGVIVSLRQGGIVSPALRHADQLPLDDIMQNLMDLISRARHGKLKSSEISKQTITVSSLGDTGVDRVQGIIYPPQVALVGFGSIKWRVQADKNSMTLAPSVWVSLAADHRTSDGLTGANFLREIAKFLSHPENL